MDLVNAVPLPGLGSKIQLTSSSVRLLCAASTIGDPVQLVSFRTSIGGHAIHMFYVNSQASATVQFSLLV